MKNSGRFAGLTLLIGLLAATSVSMARSTANRISSQPPHVVAPAVPAAMQTPVIANQHKDSDCVELAQIRRAHKRAAAYALITHEGPVADAGDDAGFFKQPETKPEPKSVAPEQCKSPQMI